MTRERRVLAPPVRTEPTGPGEDDVGVRLLARVLTYAAVGLAVIIAILVGAVVLGIAVGIFLDVSGIR